MPVTALDPSLLELVDPGVAIDQVASGYRFTEGPIWHPREHHLTFSDIPANVQYRWSEAGGARVYREASDGANGNTYDLDGNLITCEHNARRLSITRPGAAATTLVDRFEGHRLHSPNDVVCAPDGDILFTDPTYGLRQPDGTIAGQEYPHPGVFRYRPSNGELRLLAADFDAPNGIVISNDGARLFVDDSRKRHVRVFDVAADGSLRNGRVFCEVSHGEDRTVPDGMKIDSRGNLYVTANHALGLFVYNPDGKLLGYITLPESPANLAWGGDDAQTLFVTAQTSVYRLLMKVRGQAIRLR